MILPQLKQEHCNQQSLPILQVYFPQVKLIQRTAGSGNAIQGTAGQEGFGTIQQGFLEGSNVQVVEELINLIQAERAFEANSKIITSSDEMLKTVNRIG